MLEDDILVAIMEAKKKYGTQTALSHATGITQGRIADYINKRCGIGNMTIITLRRLFPDIEISFFGKKSVSPPVGIDENNVVDKKLSELIASMTPEEKVDLLMDIAVKKENKSDKVSVPTTACESKRVS